MANYQVPLRDMQFVLFELFSAHELWKDLGLEIDLDIETCMAILSEGAKISEQVLLPLLHSADEEGCAYKDGEVTTPLGFKAAYQQYAEGGWQSLGGSPEFDGQGLPKMLTVFFEEMVMASNPSFALFPTLTNGNALAVSAHASQELKETYLPKMYSGEWAGTMCLTEAHSGTDLGIIKTKALPQDDGSYSISGTKIFITGGEHDLSENIIHLVLAKLPDAPKGPKGISLFIVPKFMVNEDGSLGERNQVVAGSIEHKMGIKGSPTCVMNFDGAKGFLVGEENQGLAYMFTMMNYERLSIGIQGLGAGEIAYQNALVYAKERLQSRSPLGVQEKEKVADPIIVHPDVRRMLLLQKANNEAGRALAAYIAMQLDLAKNAADEDGKQRAQGLAELLTPVAKAFFSDNGLEGCLNAQAVFGGHGYISEWGMEQMVRDVRIAQIYEGTNGIQAMDLMGRKVVFNQGKNLAVLIEEMEAFGEKMNNQVFQSALGLAIARLQNARDVVIKQAEKDPAMVGAAATDFLKLTGIVLFTYMWCRTVELCEGKLKQDDSEKNFYLSKLKTAEFYINKVLPETASLFENIQNGSESLMIMETDLF
jgi:alkylation response protein AidB-like acyl-CoA dehydrogenase